MTVSVEPVAYRNSLRSKGWYGPSRSEGWTHTTAFVDFRHSPSKAFPHSTWPEDHHAWEYSKAALSAADKDYKEAGLSSASPAARRAMLIALRSILAPDSVYPTFSIEDDGSLVAEWLFEPMSLELYAETDGSTHFVLRKSGLAIRRSKSTTPLRRLLRDISSIVSQRNPDWRNLFAWPAH